MKGLSIRTIAKVSGGTLNLSFLTADGIFATIDEDRLAQAQPGTREAYQNLLKQEITGVTTDSRKAAEGCLFGAIAGARADGHSFIASVFDKGALCVLSERHLERKDLFGQGGSGLRQLRAWIEVEDTQKALGRIAEEYLKILKVPVVGITGSVGKTTTKEMIASVLSAGFCTLKTEGNFNNDLGLPLTVFRLGPEHQAAVLEMGVSHFGDMSRLAKIARPDIMVITNIGTCHLEFLKDRDGVFRAKTEAFSFVKPGGSVILNGNDDKLRAVREVNGKKPVFFGVDTSLEGASDLAGGEAVAFPGDLDPQQCVTVSSIRMLGFEGSACTLQTPVGELSVTVPIPGIHNASNAAAACAVGLAFGMSLDRIREGIESAQTISGRFRVLKAGNMTVIDDCYNANPVSVKSSVAVLSQGSGHRVAVLGDMAELGERELALHEEVGAYAADRVDRLIAVGRLARSLFEGARQKRPDLPCSWYETVDEFLAHRSEELLPEDTVLVKASHSMQFDRIVEELVK